MPWSGQHVFRSFFTLLKAIHTVAIEPRAIIVFSCTIDPVIRPLGLQAVIWWQLTRGCGSFEEGGEEGGGPTHTKATITSWTVPRAQWLECVCKMMWEKPFAKQREGTCEGGGVFGGVGGVGTSDCFCTIEHVHSEVEGCGGWSGRLTRPLCSPWRGVGVWFSWLTPRKKRFVPKQWGGGDGLRGGTLSTCECEASSMFSLKSQVHPWEPTFIVLLFNRTS